MVDLNMWRDKLGKITPFKKKVVSDHTDLYVNVLDYGYIEAGYDYIGVKNNVEYIDDILASKFVE